MERSADEDEKAIIVPILSDEMQKEATDIKFYNERYFVYVEDEIVYTLTKKMFELYRMHKDNERFKYCKRNGLGITVEQTAILTVLAGQRKSRENSSKD